MTDTSIRLSTPLDDRIAASLMHLARLFEDLGVSYFLVGATARDIVFHHVAGCEASPRRTMDIDISIQMDSWQAYTNTRDRMLCCGYACRDERHPEKLTFTEAGTETDLLPFGEISEDGESIIWPEDSSHWTILGFNEAYSHAATIDLGGFAIKVAIPASMVYLKMIAVDDRPEDRKKKDSLDIAYVIRNYNSVSTKLDNRAQQRLEHALRDTDLLLANAFVAGSDIGGMVEESTRMRIMNILDRQIESSSRFFDLFGSFKGFVEFFLLQDLVSSDFQSVKIFSTFNDFQSSPLPASKDEYVSYKRHAIDFIEARNRRIERYSITKVAP